MKHFLSIAVGLVLGWHSACAQQAPVISPELKADHSVVFRLKAPKAQAVAVRGQWDKQEVAMTKDADGLWSVTIPGVRAGVWEYGFIVDGLTIIDPVNPAQKPQRAASSSILHVPGTPPNVWDFQDVPHGTVHQHTYFSKSLDRLREVWVYTPPRYETDAHKSAKYPMLVLQHGSGDREGTWIVLGKANWILDNLLAAGKTKPMIVVMINGHPLGDVPREMPDRRTAAMKAFQKDLMEDALQLVQRLYRVSPDREQHAITGLSMGAAQSLNTGLNHLDQFAWIGAFSGAVEEADVKTALDDATGTNAKLQLLWIACGKDDRVQERAAKLSDTLKTRGIMHEYHVTAGDHSWPVWRDHLAAFAPLLFQ